MLTIRRSALVLCGLTVVGCELSERRPASSPEGWRTRRFEAASREKALDAATYALRQWFRIDEVRPLEGMVTTLPEEYVERGGTGRIRDDAIGYRNRMRRRATVRVRSAGEGVAVECVVLRERLDTSDHRVFAHARSFDDVPNQTPISEESATSSAQNEVWTEVGRDRQLEGDILNVMRERLGGGGGGGPAG